MNIEENFSLKRYNTFHVRATARYFVDITEVKHLQEVLAFCSAKQLPYVLIGQGSNILFQEDFPGVVIELNIKGIELIDENEEEVLIKAYCGENWHKFVMYCLESGYNGLENLSLIPGTIGAAPVQNIGAYGVELAEYCESLEAVDVTNGHKRVFSNAQCEFSYRNSVFKKGKRDQFIITSVNFRLHKHSNVNVSYPALATTLAGLSEEEITPAIVSKTVCEIRQSKLPDPEVIGNAGSFFWNPIVDESVFITLKIAYPDIPGYTETDTSKVKIPAAWLIDQAGWKGYREGDVGVHAEHALVLVNYGEATGKELVQLANKIQASVKEKFNIELWPEVRII